MRTRLLIAAAAALLFIAAPLRAEPERITHYDSHITVHTDGSMKVVETIKVIAEGRQINHGIYRDFPTTYKTSGGTTVVIPFHVDGVERDGKAEPYHTESMSNGLRIYIGSGDVAVSHGPHTYVIAYTVQRELGFYDDHDELYWNVTGNGWQFTIEHVTAEVDLPPAVPRDKIKLEGYTGVQGAKDKAYRSSVDKSGQVKFETTAPLGAEEGLTIVVGFPTGFIHRPTAAEQWQYFIESNRMLVVGACGVGVVFMYYLVAWMLVGRDPRRGVIVPLFEPPSGIGPACMRYVRRMKYDSKCFSAALIDMAVKGHIQIKDDDGEYTLLRHDRKTDDLSSAEADMADRLLTSSSMKLSNKHHIEISSAIRALQSRLEKEYDGKMFLENRSWLIAGTVLSLVAIAAMMLSGTADQIIAGGFLCVWLSFWSLGVVMLLRAVVGAWRQVFAAHGWVGKGGSVLAAIYITAFSVPFVAGEVVATYFLSQQTSMWVAPIVLTLAGLGLVFFELLKAPTGAGRKLMDQIDGFRMYLATTEGDELNAPKRTPQLFEKYLPYALALGVENEWAERFSDVLAAAAARTDQPGMTGYSPAWYIGTGAFAAASIATFAGGLGNSLGGAISSAATAPGSSSGFSGGGGFGGGGGGSSGGGGGGGGGGGW